MSLEPAGGSRRSRLLDQASQLVLLVVAGTGGLLAVLLNVPGGAVVGSLLFAVAITLLGLTREPLGSFLRQLGLIMLGTVVGSRLSVETLRELAGLWPHVLVLVVTLSLASISTGLILRYVSGVDVLTSMFAAVPGGMSTMAAVAHDEGGDGALVAALHVVRLVVVLAGMPLLVTVMVGH